MFGEEAIAQQLAEARSALDEVRQQQERPVQSVTAESADGRIEVTLGPNGRVTKFRFAEERVLKEGTEFLEVEIAKAVNAALDARAEALSADVPTPDLEAIGAAVAQIQEQGVRQMRDMTAHISQVMAKLQGGK
ncbi:YbaB/EbfC DNA-binding family protein [Glycomyces sambucus]|uniref:YbaB/EbfC DNA-binding family protein n=1 Tax=Glycomyces sambucus TaxID=380244 RepID=A0A1G9J1J3_9ACTN|nr:YbaB/EbfC family nucleoid-associated protein [Glycomyces sambucus]SDL31004.1 YbaB/EbfC DNA-binding family protein [Glycomyces sambucus]